MILYLYKIEAFQILILYAVLHLVYKSFLNLYRTLDVQVPLALDRLKTFSFHNLLAVSVK